MGVARHKNSRRKVRSPRILAGLVGGLSLALAGAAFADSGPVARTGPAQDGEPPVSTSPELARRKGATGAPSPLPGVSHRPALTRAASRQRIETMTPLGWLERYGFVEVDGLDIPVAQRP